jgi:hypothetical protein
VLLQVITGAVKLNYEIHGTLATRCISFVQRSPFVCTEIRQLNCVPLQNRAAIPSHRTLWATGQVGQFSCHDS